MSFFDFILGSTPGNAVGEAGQKVVEGVFTGVKEIIKEFHLSPEAEIKLNLAMEQARLELFKARIQDVQSARQMEMVTRSRMPALLAMFYTVSFVGISCVLLWYAFEMPEAHMNNFQAGLVGMIYMHVAKEAMMGSAFYLGGTIKEEDFRIENVMLRQQQNGEGK